MVSSVIMNIHFIIYDERERWLIAHFIAVMCEHATSSTWRETSMTHPRQ